MITIPLSTEDLTKVRLAPSPLWETVASFAVLLHHHGRHTVHAPWVTRARRVLPGSDLSAMVAAMCLEKHCPDFLSPPPDASVATFGEELERLRATPPEVVLKEVQMLVQDVVVVEGPAKTVYVGGQDSVDASGNIVGKGDIAAQTEQVLANLRAALAAGGARPEHVIKWNLLMAEGQSLEAGFSAFRRAWPDTPNPPAITFAFVAGLAHPDFLVEMDAVAVVPL